MPPVVPSRIGVTLSVIGILGAALAFLFSSHKCRLVCNELNLQHSHAGYFEYECAGKPHQASWKSWHHPQSLSRSDELSENHGPRAGVVTKDWNILYHLGGNGPWVEKVVDVVDGGIAVPEGCEVEQVHMMARHAERYPTKRVGQRVKTLVERMRQSGITFRDELAFFNDWELFWNDDSRIEQLTSTGPFSGTLGAFTTGVRLRTRYYNLLLRTLSQRSITRLWASDCQRVIETARHFAAGFFGLDWQDTALLDAISEDSSQGANTLTPGDTCLTYVDDEVEGHDKGYVMLAEYRATYLGTIRERLLKQNPGIEFTDDEIYAMQEMCGFETTVRGSSHWCNVFTRNEFLSFEYARDLLHYYRAGPGTKYGALMGWLWLNATTNLMLEGPEAGPLFFSFVHDGDIAPMITALDIINDEEHLPITHVQHDRKWRKSQVSPMGGRTIFEVLSCPTTDNDKGSEKFVRININDGITAIPGCDSGPGRSCPLGDFAARTRRKGEEVGDFRERCGLSEDAADRVTFLHQ